MAMGFINFIILLPLIGAGNGNLVDFIDVPLYWQTQGIEITEQAMLGQLGGPARQIDAAKLIEQLGSVDYQIREKAHKQLASLGVGAKTQLTKGAKSTDPEVAMRCKQLIEQITQIELSKELRCLMAIRALGQLKSKASLARLELIAKNGTNFEKYYAINAVSLIKTGKPHLFKSDSKQLAKDLWLLPKTCGAVGQINRNELGQDIDEILKTIAKMPLIGQQMGQLKKEMNKQLTEIVEMVGPIQLDSVTFGVAENVGNKTGYVAFIGNGLYDKKRITHFLAKELRKEPTIIHGYTVFQPESEFAIVLISDRRAMFIAGPNQQTLPLNELLLAEKNGKGTLAENTKLASVIKQVNQSKSAWAVAVVNDHFWETIEMERSAMPIGSIETLLLEIDQQPNVVNFKLIANGKDKANVVASSDMVKAWLQMGITMLQKQQKQQNMPIIKTMIDLMQSVKLETKETTLTGTAKLNGSVTQLIMLPILGFMAF